MRVPALMIVLLVAALAVAGCTPDIYDWISIGQGVFGKLANNYCDTPPCERNAVLVGRAVTVYDADPNVEPDAEIVGETSSNEDGFFEIALGMTAFYALGSGAILFAGERETGTYELQLVAGADPAPILLRFTLR